MQENACLNVVCEIVAVLTQPQYVNISVLPHSLWSSMKITSATPLIEGHVTIRVWSYKFILHA